MDWKGIKESVSTDSSDGAAIKKRLPKKDKANSGLLFPSSKISVVYNSRLWNMDSCWNWLQHAHRNLVEQKAKEDGIIVESEK
ncbi:hypothetical protein DH2020_046743 [Rehmannia glutinosa]|uniref:Uncharacterized protein n=1 Tax=Rehmannia glutinosa TaxID=99300 RepID=A0ABR0UB49_REHGL